MRSSRLESKNLLYVSLRGRDKKSLFLISDVIEL